MFQITRLETSLDRPKSQRRSDEGASRAGSRLRIGSWARARTGLFALLFAFASLSLAAGAASGSRTELEARGPGAVFASVDAAALDALVYAHLNETPMDRRRLRVGAIYRVENGFSYAPAKRSTDRCPRMAPSVRLQLRAVDVARYVIPPLSGRARINRQHEELSPNEKRIVDEFDPAHRPLYKLTPSHNVVSYRRGGQTRIIVNLKDLAGPKIPKPVSAAKRAPAAAESAALLARNAAPATAD